MKKQLKILLVPLYLTSCTSTQVASNSEPINAEVINSGNVKLDIEFLKLSDCAESNSQRAPSSQVSCKKYYEADKTISTSEKKEIIGDLQSLLRGKTIYAEQYGMTENKGLWAMFLDSKTMNQSVKSDIHPVEFMTDSQIKYISKGWKALKGISDSNFRLSKELAEDVNKLLIGDVETTVMQEINQRFAAENENVKKSLSESLRSNMKKYLGVDTGYRRSSEVLDLTDNPVSEVEFKKIKENFERVGGRIEESPTSEVNKRSFMAYFPKGKEVSGTLASILSSANAEISKLKTASYGEQLEFIADLHLKLKILHPFTKLNDLTVQMLINRCLIQLGIDPAIRVDFDFSMTKQQIADLYRKAINDYIKYTISTYDILLKDGELVVQEAPELLRIGTRIKIYGKYQKNYPKALEIMRTKGSATPFDEKYVRLGVDQRMYVFKDDGFLYDGITPHMFRVEDGITKLYPVSDSLYKLLSLNGDYNGEVGARRDLPPEYFEIVKNNLRNVESVLNKKTNSLDVKVIYDAKLIEANKKGELYFYSWQLPVLERASLINENPIENPYAVLVPTRGDAVNVKRGGSFTFEKNFFRGYRGNKIGDLIGHYEQMDLDYNQFARSVKNNPSIPEAKKQKILANIHESRSKMHTAARELLRPFLDGVADLNKKDLDDLRSNANFLILEDYLRNFSKLKYENFDKAIEAMGDDFVYVHRVQSALSVFFLGLWSQTQVKNLALANFLVDHDILVPQLREIYALMQSQKEQKQLDDTFSLSYEVKKKIAEISKGNKSLEGTLGYFVKRVFIKKQQYIQNVEEFQSQFITHYLHAVNKGNKIGVSTSADPTYLLVVKSYRELAMMPVHDDLVKLFRTYKNDTTTPKEDAKKWLKDLAEKELTKKLSADYYRYGWLGAFAKEFKLDVNDVLLVVNRGKPQADKFTKQDDGTIYVLRIPVDQIQANHISGTVESFSAQFENTTNTGYSSVKSLIGVFSRPIIQKNYRSQKLSVDLARMSDNAMAIYDQILKPLEVTADFTGYKKFSEVSVEVPKILRDLFDPNQMTYDKAINSLSTLKYDLQTLKTPESIESFKTVIEDVFNTTLKVVEYQKDPATRKRILAALTKFLANHTIQRGGELISGWSLELWETSLSKNYSKDIMSKANSEVRSYRKLLKLATDKEESQGKSASEVSQ